MLRIKQEGEQKNVKQRIKELKRLIARAKDHAKLALLERELAEAYVENGQISKAIVHYKNAESEFEDLRDFSQLSEVLGGLATCNQLLQRYKDAIKYLKEQLKLVLEHITSQTALETAQQQIYYKLGLTYFLMDSTMVDEEVDKDYLAKALENLEKSQKIIKGSEGNWKDKVAECEVNDCLARVYKKQKEYKRAIEYLKLVVPKTDCFPDDALQDYITIAHCYAKLKNYKKACTYLEKTVKFMDDRTDLLLIRARVYADLGDYYFKLHDFDKSLLNFRKNLRIFKQTRFDKEKFENAVENLRNAKKAACIAKKRREIAEKLKTTKGAKTRMKLLEQTGDYAFDLSDEKEAIEAYEEVLKLCEGDIKKTIEINKSIGNAWDTLASKEENVEYAKKAIEYFTKNFELCKARQDDSGMAEALTEIATTRELPALETDNSEILKIYERAEVCATRARNYKLLATIYGNISALFERWPGKQKQSQKYADKARVNMEKGSEEEEPEKEIEDEEEEDEENDEDLCDVQDYLDGNITVDADPVEMKTKLGSVIKRLQEKQKKKTAIIPLQEGKYDKNGNLLPAYRDDFIVEDNAMHPVAKQSLNRLLHKDDEPSLQKGSKEMPIKIESTKSGLKTESPEKATTKIEQFIANARQKKDILKKEMDDEALTPYQEQRKRQRIAEQNNLAKLQTKKKINVEKETENVRKQHIPQENIIETKMIDKETGKKVLVNKKTGKVLRSYQEDFIVADDEEYDSDDLNADYDYKEEEENSDKKHLPSYTKNFIVDD